MEQASHLANVSPVLIEMISAVDSQFNIVPDMADKNKIQEWWKDGQSIVHLKAIMKFAFLETHNFFCINYLLSLYSTVDNRKRIMGKMGEK